jgi:hypothetical protein
LLLDVTYPAGIDSGQKGASMKPPSWNTLIVVYAVLLTVLILVLERRGTIVVSDAGWFALQAVLANIGACAYLRYLILSDDRIFEVAMRMRQDREARRSSSAHHDHPDDGAQGY